MIINKLDLFSKKIEIISELVFSAEIANKFKTQLINQMTLIEIYDKSSMIDFFKQTEFYKFILDIGKKAPIKMIFKDKTDEQLLLIFEELIEEIKKIDLNTKIENLENKMSKDMTEKIFEELLELKRQVKSG